MEQIVQLRFMFPMHARKRLSNSSGSSSEDHDHHVDVSAFLVSKYRRFYGDEFEDPEREALVRKRVQMRRMAARLLACCSSLMEAYVSYRGGLNEMRNFVVPSIEFDAASFDDKMFVSFFRFEREEIEMIISGLNLPSHIVTNHRDKDTSFNVFCLMCCKYAFPGRYAHMIRVFGRSAPSMSRLISALRESIYIEFCNGLRNPAPLSAEECACFAAAIRPFCGLPVVVGFIDGTVREICKPSVLQGPLYNGKDRKHSLKYQAITTPDGMIKHLAGPYPGTRHDQFMLHDSEILEWIGSFPLQPDTQCPYQIYADAGYSSVPGIIVPYHDPELNATHAGFNMAMSSVRISVEWAFGAILQNWASLRYVPHEQLLSNRKIGQIYFCAALLTNFMNCVRPNTTSKYFSVQPPSLETYLATLKLHFHSSAEELLALRSA
jgi:hypothetical protein